jgi:hypothetical protein
MGKTKTTSRFWINMAVIAVVLAAGISQCRTAQATPPADQTYVGVKKCAACHFEQYMTWKKSKHALTFDTLPADYKTNATCLKCHTTGYGTPTGFKDAASTPQLISNGCENCHGPGSAHCTIAEKYATKKTLSAEEQAEVRGSTWKTLPENVCAKCHMVIAHKAHEEYKKDK